MARSAALGSALVVLALATSALAGDVSMKLDGGAGFSVKNGTGAVERLRVDEATGNISRNGALFVHTTGTVNLFVGDGAGNLGTTGFGYNAALGRDALHSNISGAENAAVGANALRANTSGNANSAFGAFALFANTAGAGNSALGTSALAGNTTGNSNSAVGVGALFGNTTGNYNSAFGRKALYTNTTGFSNSAVGSNALFSNTAGNWNSAFGGNALRFNTTGNYNSAFGGGALYGNTAGYSNSAFGQSALLNNSSGSRNSAFGRSALVSNTTGTYNSAVGKSALAANTTGGLNTAVGYFALGSNTVGGYNSAFGNTALRNNTTGLRNVAVGRDAGFNQTTGSDNIYLANTGVAAESGQIKIGTVGTHTATTIAGISGTTSSGGVAVLVNASGKLGTTTSSARFKEDVRDMGDASDVLMKLRPVVFRYREDAVGAEDAKTTQYGLIAEEVEQVAPELVAPDLDGKPNSVKYHELPALLLNEVKAQHHINEEQARLIADQRQVIAALSARIEKLEARR